MNSINWLEMRAAADIIVKLYNLERFHSEEPIEMGNKRYSIIEKLYDIINNNLVELTQKIETEEKIEDNQDTPESLAADFNPNSEDMIKAAMALAGSARTSTEVMKDLSEAFRI